MEYVIYKFPESDLTVKSNSVNVLCIKMLISLTKSTYFSKIQTFLGDFFFKLVIFQEFGPN
jgi:hypothetical protein